jgi:succinoglycan biosynthesis protein ExoM
MLERCLKSLISQAVPNTITAFIIVIDNDPAGGARAIAAPFSVRYIHAPRRGIAIARNAALDAAFATGADWIAFIDDDEIAAPDWIAQLMAPEYLGVPILTGREEVEYPSPPPFWCAPNKRELNPAHEGRRRGTATTGNVRFSADLIYAGLRFNEAIGLMGGEDIEFFGRARAMGFQIRQTLRAVTIETAHRERLTLPGQLYRHFWCAASDVVAVQKVRGKYRALSRKLHTIPLSIAIGAVEIAISPLFSVIGLDAFKRRVLAGGKKIAKGAGRAAAIVGIMPQPYRVIVGE